MKPQLPTNDFPGRSRPINTRWFAASAEKVSAQGYAALALRFRHTSEVPGNRLIGSGPVQPRVLLHRLPRRSLAEAPQDEHPICTLDLLAGS